MKDFVEVLQKLLPWAAGLPLAPKIVISVIIFSCATLLLLLIWAPTQQVSQSTLEATHVNATKVAISTGSVSPTPAQDNISEKDDWRKNVKTMYEAANAISYDSTSRNKALHDVVTTSLRFNDYGFAIKVAQEISYDSTVTNNTLEEIVKHSCNNQEYDFANKAADLISYDSTKKNKNKKMILDAISGNLTK